MPEEALHPHVAADVLTTTSSRPETTGASAFMLQTCRRLQLQTRTSSVMLLAGALCQPLKNLLPGGTR
jgi:hypothetical protein